MAAKVRYFKVLGGNHAEGEKIYEVGKIVETTRDLIAMFGANKFKETNKKGRVLDPDEDDATDLSEAEEKPAAQESSEAKSEANPKGTEADTNATQVEKIESKLGEDVSDQFGAVVSENDLAVVSKGKKFFVVDRDDPDAALNGDEELTSKKAVNVFVDKFLKG